MYPQITWELVADPLRSMEHTLGTTALDPSLNIMEVQLCCCWMGGFRGLVIYTTAKDSIDMTITVNTTGKLA
jgi:hypothetical protein